MITIELPETSRRLYLPEQLSECDERQYAEACLLIWRYQQGKLSYLDFRVEMIYKLLDLKRTKATKLVESEVDHMAANIFQLSEQIDSFFEVIDDKLRIKQYYNHNHTPTVRHIFPELKGPKDEFEDITFGQYIDALNLYSMLEAGMDPELLYRFMGIFYHPKGQKYDPKRAEKHLRTFKYIHFGKVYGFYLLFTSFQKYLFTAKVYYQGMELDLSILFSKAEGEKSEPESKIPGLGMLSIAHQLAESGVYGPIKEVRDTNFWEVLLRLYDIRKRDLDHQERQKREEEKAKAKKK